MLITSIVGLAGAMVLTFIISTCYYLLIDIDYSLFDLQIFPAGSTIILFLSLSLFLFSVGHALTSICGYLLKKEKESYNLFLIVAMTSFVLALIFLQLYLPSELSLNWATWISTLFFIIILGIATIRRNFVKFTSLSSVIRSITLGSFFLAVLGYPILKYAKYIHVESQLMNSVSEFQEREDHLARNITRDMLTSLEQELSGITREDLNERVPYLQSTFSETIEQNLLPQMRIYSYNLQLIKPSGELIADYSTDLNAPGWTSISDLDYLSAATEIERITKANNRPIVQMPQLQNSGDYETFYRGWIPIFSPENSDQIAWILCSVYNEQPDLDKPIRAVMASMTNSNWNTSLLLLEYMDGQLVRSNSSGMAGNYPRYNKLREAEMQAIAADSVVFYTSTEAQRAYQNLLVRTSDDSVIKATSMYPSITKELFSFFRLHFSLLLVGLVLVPVYLFITVGKSAFKQSHQRFEHRIVDRLLLASLLFLGLLVGTTHFAIKKQNKEIVRQNLDEKLEKLATATKDDPQFNRIITADAPFSMQDIVTPFDVDASFYNNTMLRQSTTPQIYQQNLLPTVLPFDVYYELFVRQKSQAMGTVELASQNLLIGYKSLLSQEGNPVATVSIPTFLESPKYDQQLLETTSYLIVFYRFTFGIFIIATTVIARQITEPLRSIQKGLNKISEGNLDTKIPVKSDDEIGTLAEAYNEMVERLKQVRKELAIAERQAAWKEMAQQVAHEIKNPLTPMKLNIQHLERQLSNGMQDPEQLTQNIKKITSNLTEQIQTLNSIASDFSKFSKPIDEEFTKVDINQIIKSVADLYRQDEETDIKTELTQYPIFVSGVRGRTAPRDYQPCEERV
ncbi:MAG: HAMP domain-containing protein [Balneolaceae bacterium]|nr:HAMP domain-containing protein [Balneolaceae bacterium]